MAVTIGQVLSFTRVTRRGAKLADVKVATGSVPVTADHTGAPGDDCPPLPTDFVVMVPGENTGRGIAVGYVDPLNQGTASPGEKRYVGRDPDAVEVCELYLKRDGEATLSNANGSIVLGADGSIALTSPGGSIALDAAGLVSINGATISALGEIANALGIILGTHSHIGSPSAPSGGVSNTGAPV